MPVQGDAFVAKSAIVDQGAQVTGHARVLHHAVVRGQVRVLDDALIGHHARVLGGPGPQGVTYVHGTAEIDGHAVIGSGADVAHPRHVLTVTGVGPDARTLTLYRRHPVLDVDGVWRWTHGVHLTGWYGTLDNLYDLADPWPGRLRDELDNAIDLLHCRRGEWEDEEVTNPDRKRWQLRDSDLRRLGKRAAADAARAAGIPLPQPRPKATTQRAPKAVRLATQRERDAAAAAYDPQANDYDLAKDPRCLWGWGPPTAGCIHTRFGHTCFRAFGHPGKCADPMDQPPEYPCERHQRPADWDTTGRAEANR
jgi:hypothetical protein